MLPILNSYYGPNVDVWALGILLYFMVVGSLPFRAETVAKLKRCILDGVYPAPPADRVSDDCRFLIRCILRPAPSDRYSLDEIRRADWLNGAVFPRPSRPHSFGASSSSQPVLGGETGGRRRRHKEHRRRSSDPGRSPSGSTGTAAAILAETWATTTRTAADDDGTKTGEDGKEDEEVVVVGEDAAGGESRRSSEADRSESDGEGKQLMAECELEARAQLEEYGITEQHLQAASSRRSRSSISGIYQVCRRRLNIFSCLALC